MSSLLQVPASTNPQLRSGPLSLRPTLNIYQFAFIVEISAVLLHQKTYQFLLILKLDGKKKFLEDRMYEK